MKLIQLLQEGKAVPTEDAESVGKKLGVNFKEIDLEEFRIGLEDEVNEHSDVIGTDLVAAGKIALAHLKKIDKHYYTKLAKYNLA